MADIQTRTGLAPFDDKDIYADAILSSSDGTDFYVAAAILCYSSHVFKTYLEGASQAKAGDSGKGRPFTDGDGKIRWKLQEGSIVVDCLLRHIYPIRPPNMDLQTICRVLEMATRYSVTRVIDVLAEKLKSFVGSEPLRVYAVAYRNGLQELAKEAAGSMLDSRPQISGNSFVFDNPLLKWTDMYCDEMEAIDARAYNNLIEYVQQSGTRSLDIHCHPLFCVDRYEMSSPSIAHLSCVATPTTFCFNDSDITIRSADGVDFRVHKFILKHAFDAFSGMFEIGSATGEPIQWQESSSTCDALLRFCYPYKEKPSLSEPKQAGEVLAAAIKYAGKDALVSTIRAQYEAVMRVDPLTAYAVACQMKNKMDSESDARIAARRSLVRPILFVPEMANISAADYFRLLKYHKAIRDPLIDKFSPNGVIAQNYLSPATKRSGQSCSYMNPGCVSEEWQTACLDQMKTAVTNELKPAALYDSSKLQTILQSSQCAEAACHHHATTFAVMQAFDGISKEFNKAVKTIKLEWRA